jgi:hypothetical protein
MQEAPAVTKLLSNLLLYIFTTLGPNCKALMTLSYAVPLIS